MGLTAGGPILPVMLVAPLAAMMFFAVTGHLWLLKTAAKMPASRKRIRTANGVLMLLTIPVGMYAMCMASTAAPREFVLAWLAVVGLLGVVMLLACLDILNNLRLRHGDRRRLAEDIAVLRKDLATVRAMRASRMTSSRDDADHHSDDRSAH